MRLTEFISEACIRVPLKARDKEAVVRELLATLPLTDEAALASTLDSVMERERLMSTGIGHGIAIPHGTGPVGAPVAAALGVASEPLEFDAIDGAPVHLVFLVLSQEGQQVAGMRALARLSRLLHNDAFRKALHEARDAAEAMDAIRAEEGRHRV